MRTGLSALAAGIGTRTLPEKIVPVELAATARAMLAAFASFAFIPCVWRKLGFTASYPNMACAGIQ